VNVNRAPGSHAKRLAEQHNFPSQILNPRLARNCAANYFNSSTTSSSAKQPHTAKMGRVRTKTVKKSAKVIIERYYPKLTLDFETNKRICDEIAIIASKRLRNKVRRLCTTFTTKSASF
jgi:ribosomal protein S17E